MNSLVQFAGSRPEHGAWMGAYVIMPDLMHAFVALDNGDRYSLGGWMKALKNALSKTLREAGVDAQHWQKGCFDHVLRSAESCAEKWDHVRDNPVRAGLVVQ